ncbi:hypothetical protein EGY05_00135 [Chryseobacterium arthrosphaerae]|nr:hypothetical protein EGY05_00135 [Chryseobacterium arthrosphaerae]
MPYYLLLITYYLLLITYYLLLITYYLLLMTTLPPLALIETVTPQHRLESCRIDAWKRKA